MHPQSLSPLVPCTLTRDNSGRWRREGADVGPELRLHASDHDGLTAVLGRYRFTAVDGRWSLGGRWPQGETLRVGGLYRTVEITRA